MKSICLVLALLGAMAVSAAESEWGSDYEKALAVAREKQRPVLLDFTAPWCPPCRLMEQTTFQDAVVRTNLGRFAAVKIDFDKNPELVARYSIRSIPAYIVLNSDGEEAARSGGYQDAATFSEWLSAGLGAAALSSAQKEIFEEQRLAAATALQSSTVAERQRGVGLLLDFCARKEKYYQEHAAAKLKTLAAREPELLLPALVHPRLAARIQAANALREKLGDDFKVDPWNQPEAREAGMREWEKRLAKTGGK